MSTRPPIFQMLVVGFAVLCVGFVSVSTVVAVSTKPSAGGIQRTVARETPRVADSAWSTVAVAQHFGAWRASHPQ